MIRNRIGIWAAVALFTVAVLTFVGTVLYTINQQEQTNATICRSSVDNRRAVRLTWDSARDLILAGVTDQGRIEATNQFFNAVLERVPEIRCDGGEPVEVRP